MLILDLFAGGGGFKSGVSSPDRNVISIEWNPDRKKREAIANVHNLNHQEGDLFINESIMEVDPSMFAGEIDWLHASPPCQSFSGANVRDRGEQEGDYAIAQRVAHYIRVIRPPKFSLENVSAYAQSGAYAVIKEALEEVYGVEGFKVQILDMADYGVPQKRRRFWVVAGGRFPEKQQKIGWLEAIGDLLPDMTSAELTDVQKESLASIGERWDDPSQPLLMIRTGYRRDKGERHLTTKGCLAPAMTITCALFTRWFKKEAKALNVLLPKDLAESLDIPQCMNLSMRGAARLQGFPDSFQLSGNPFADGLAIGNAVPPSFSRLLLESFES